MQARNSKGAVGRVVGIGSEPEWQGSRYRPVFLCCLLATRHTHMPAEMLIIRNRYELSKKKLWYLKFVFQTCKQSMYFNVFALVYVHIETGRWLLNTMLKILMEIIYVLMFPEHNYLSLLLLFFERLLLRGP